MTVKEYLLGLDVTNTDKESIARIKNKYSDNLPDIIIKIISNAKETIFFDDDSRILSYDEIMDAEKDLHVQFKEKGMIPLIDCGENDFIVYHFTNKIWSKFNIVDETVFKRRKTIEEILR